MLEVVIADRDFRIGTTWLLPKANEWLIHVFAQLLLDELKILFFMIIVVVLACYDFLATII